MPNFFKNDVVGSYQTSHRMPTKIADSIIQVAESLLKLEVLSL